MNLHYHFSATEARLPEAKIVNEELKRLLSTYPDAAIFVTGDYNCETFTPEFAAMLEGLPMETGMYFFLDFSCCCCCQSCPTLCDRIDGSPPGSPSLGFSRPEHWSGLPFPSPMHASEK